MTAAAISKWWQGATEWATKLTPSIEQWLRHTQIMSKDFTQEHSM